MLRRRLALGAAANAAGKGWVLLAQLATVPLLTSTWGVSGYGLWLMISAIPTYIALSDFGFGTAAAVEMTRHHASKQSHHMVRAFQSVWVLVSSISVLIAALAFGLRLLRPMFEHHLSAQFATPDLWNAALLMVGSALCSLQMNLIGTGFRATGRYAEGTVLADLVFPISTAALIVTALCGGHMMAGALAIFGVRAAALPLYYAMMRRGAPTLKVGVGNASLVQIRLLAKPSLASLGLTLAQALSIQGVVLTVGLIISPAAAGIYSTVRTIIRAPLQLVGLTARATVPELTSAYAVGDVRTVQRLTKLNTAIAVIAALPSAAALALIGPAAVKLLSHGHLNASHLIFALLGVGMVAEATWNALAQTFLAINEQHRFTPIYALITLTVVLSPFWLHKIEPVAAISAVGEAVMLCVLSITSRKFFFQCWLSDPVDLDPSLLNSTTKGLVKR